MKIRFEIRDDYFEIFRICLRSRLVRRRKFWSMLEFQVSDSRVEKCRSKKSINQLDVLPDASSNGPFLSVGSLKLCLFIRDTCAARFSLRTSTPKSDVSGMVSVDSNESELTSESGFDESGATLVGSNQSTRRLPPPASTLPSSPPCVNTIVATKFAREFFPNHSKINLLQYERVKGIERYFSFLFLF